MMRIAHFIGLENLFHLIVGTYHRPVEERKVLLFLDINGSTALAEKLGALATRSLVRKFLFDLSQPITDHGGDIYLYKGDGLIAVWNWDQAIRDDTVLRAVDAMFGAIARERAAYLNSFGVVPGFRVGLHGGNVIVSEQGDTKRSIGIYGDPINIAARMEEAARRHGVPCVLSQTLADALQDQSRIRRSARSPSKVSRRRWRSASIAPTPKPPAMASGPEPLTTGLSWRRNNPTPFHVRNKQGERSRC